jgi:hypothetical protein
VETAGRKGLSNATTATPARSTNGANTQVCVDDKPAACAGQAVCDTPAPPNCTTVTNGFGMLMFEKIASILVVTDRV